MEHTKLIALIVEKTGIKLEANDPAFILVELNRIALEESAKKIADNLTVSANIFQTTTTTNVDNFVGIANEALTKFNQKTTELIAAIEATTPNKPSNVTNTHQARPINPPAYTDPTPQQSHQQANKTWLIPIGLFCCFLGGTLFGVTLTLFAQG